MGLDMNGTHQVLAYADGINLISDDIGTIERNAEVLLNIVRKTENFKYFGSLLTNKNSLLKQIKFRLKSENSYYSIQTRFSSRLLSKNLKNEIYKTIYCQLRYIVLKRGLLR